MNNENTTATRADVQRLVILPEQALLTFAGILRQSTDERVREAAQQLYAEVKKSRIKP